MSIDEQAMRMRTTRLRLAQSKSERRRAVAYFPLRVASLAKDLKSLCDTHDSFPILENGEEVMQYLEDEIRGCYRETFGTELGQ